MESPPPANTPDNGPARLLIKALVLVSAVAFLATVMINACARPSGAFRTEAFPATKAGPLVRPSRGTPHDETAAQAAPQVQTPELAPQRKPPPPRKSEHPYMPATKAAPVFSPENPPTEAE
jgi:hypothetical protein